MRASELALSAGLVVVSLAVLLGLGEIALRIHTSRAIFYDVEMTRYANEVKVPVANPRQGDVHRPGASARLMGVQVDISSAGLRDDEYPVERTGRRRLAFLGDSLTFGWGVEKDEMFESVIERELGDTEILNFAAGNYNTEQQVERFLTIGLPYEPDAVVVFYFINDAEPTPQRSRWAFLSRSRMFTFVWSRIKTVRARHGSGVSFLDYYKGLNDDAHPNALAHGMIAESVLPWLSRLTPDE